MGEKMLHEIWPDTYDPAFTMKKAAPESMALAYDGNKVLSYQRNGKVALADFRTLYDLLSETVEKEKADAEYQRILDNAYYLFSISGKEYFLAEPDLRQVPVIADKEELAEKKEGKDGKPFFFLMNINRFREFVLLKEEPETLSEAAEDQSSTMNIVTTIFAAATGGHMAWWKRSRRFCGFCSTETVPSETERAMVCPKCGNIEYPKISPAVIVAIIKRGETRDKDQLLLVRNNYGAYRKLALVAGFVEIGESFEQAVHREVMEEVGLKVKNLRYYKNQPWGLSYAQMIGFTAELDGEDTIRLQENELSEGGFYTREEVPDHPFRLSVGNEMLHRFKAGEL